MISIVMCTARFNPRYGEMADSLCVAGERAGVHFELVAVDEQMWYAPKERTQMVAAAVRGRFPFQVVAPKPNVWRGPWRLTKRDHWAKQSALNTAICFVKFPHVAFFDDCTVVHPNWLVWHAWAARQGLATAGAYVYVYPGALVEGGRMVEYRRHSPGDHRVQLQPEQGPAKYPGWLFGGNMSLPLEVILRCNGWEELLCGSGGLEDAEFSVRVSRMVTPWWTPAAVVFQLTDSHDVIGDHHGGAVADILGGQKAEVAKQCKGFPYRDADGVIHHFTWNHVPIWWLSAHDRGPHPDGVNFVPVYNPELEEHRTRVTTVGNTFNLRELRAHVQAGGAFPVPTEPTRDWRDGQALESME